MDFPAAFVLFIIPCGQNLLSNTPKIKWYAVTKSFHDDVMSTPEVLECPNGFKLNISNFISSLEKLYLTEMGLLL